MRSFPASVDGFIARKNGDIDWLSVVERSGEDYGYYDFISTVDTVIIGRKTYDKVLSFGIGFPHTEKECFVLTRSKRSAIGNIKFYDNDLSELIFSLKARQGKNIFVDGGGEIIHELLLMDLIDEFIISIIPVSLGDGIRLFRSGRLEQKLRCIGVKKYDSGLVQVHYCVNHGKE